MNLWHLKDKEKAKIQSFLEELSPQYQCRLRELGFDASLDITCVKTTPFGGPRVYQVGDSIFSLTQDIASQIAISLEL